MERKQSSYFLKTKDKKEIDFFVIRDEEPFLMIEVKWADNTPSRNFPIFTKYFPGIKKIQIVKDLNREKTYPDGNRNTISTQLANQLLPGLTLSLKPKTCKHLFC